MKTAKEWLLKQLNGFENHEDYKEDNIKAIADFMEHYAKYYHEQQVNSVDLANVVGQSEQYHCELFYFGRCENPCDKQCDSCYWMESKKQ